MAKHPARFACWIVVCLSGALALEGCGSTQDMNLAPISTAGSLQSTIVGRSSNNGDNELTVQESASIDVASYIWQPWFVQVRGGVDFAHDKTFGSEGDSSFSGSADATISVLPMSNYPVTLGLAHSDSYASGDFSGDRSTSDRAFINASAVLTQNLRGGMSASWDRTDQEDSGIQNTQTVSLNLQQTFPRDEAPIGITSIGLSVGLENSEFTATDPDEEDGSHQLATVQLDTRSEPIENVSYNSLMTAIYDDEADGDDTTTRMSFQGVSTVQWRPENQPFIVTGTLRALAEKIDRDDDFGSSGTDTLLATATLGMRWPGGSYEDVSRDEGGSLGEDAIEDGLRFDAVIFASANYVAEQRPLAGFDWRWDARASTENGANEDGLVTRESIGLGHRFERMLEDLIFVPVRFSFDQSIDLGFDPDGDDTFNVGLSDSIAFSYSGAEAASSTFARLFFSDTRSLIGEQREFQMIQARIGRRVAISRQRRLQGDLSAQGSRQVDEDDSDVFVTASGNFTYSHRDLFDIENLGLRSEVRINAVNLDELFGKSSKLGNDLLRNDWRNTLIYRIGRLAASIETTVFQRGSEFDYLALLRFRRDFGGGE